MFIVLGRRIFGIMFVVFGGLEFLKGDESVPAF